MDAILQFLQEAFTMPTTVFSTLLGLVILYWTAGLLGFGGLEGVGDGLAEGMADGVLDGAADAVLDGAADGALDGVTDGGLEGGLESGLFAAFGEMPKIVFLSLVVFFAWLFTFFGMRYIPQLVSVAFHGLALAVVLSGLAVVFAVALAFAALVPLAKFFRAAPATKSRDLVGKTCTVRTLRVTGSFGQGEVDGKSYLLEIRADEPNSLTRGSPVVIFDYDKKQEAFLVLPYGERHPEKTQ